MQKYQIIGIIFMLCMSGCTPKYITKITKIPPSTKEGMRCLQSCNQKYEKDEEKYVKRCRAKVLACKGSKKKSAIANFSVHQNRYQENFAFYENDLIRYQDSLAIYKEKLDEYNENKREDRELYEDAMNDYRDKRYKYDTQRKAYFKWKKDQKHLEDDYFEYQYKCKRSTDKKNFFCKKARELYLKKSQKKFGSFLNKPHKPSVKPKKPKKREREHPLIKPKKPIRPFAPLKPILSTFIDKEQKRCNNNCSYMVNNCFSTCGGTIKHEQICVEHCD